MGGGIKKEVLLGLFGVATNDISLEREIRNLSRTIGLDANFSLQLIDLVENRDCTTIFQNVGEMC